MTTSPKTFAQILATRLAVNLLIVGTLGCGVYIADLSEPAAQTSTPGVSECWDGMQVRTVAGEC
jgi:hypothetical protein